VSNLATLQITPDQNELIGEIHIAAPPERVFEALTDPRQVLQWWGQAGMYRCTEYTADVRPGGKWHSAGEGGQVGSFQAFGEFLKVDPPRLLAYTWVASWTGDVQTTVQWELEPVGKGTLVRIRHSGLAARPDLAQSYRGWSNILGWIQAFVEAGETVETRKAS
jgi:uncharacterized protein YndB with AHSA1/START domain